MPQPHEAYERGYEAGQKAMKMHMKERIRARIYVAANKTWRAVDTYIGPPHWTLTQFVDALLEDGNDSERR